MKKVFICLLAALMLMAAGAGAFADSMKNEEKYTAEFTGNELSIIGYDEGKIAEIVNSMQPGDDVTITIYLRNSSSGSVAWYMHNEAIKTMEESVSSAAGGLYTYRLTYTDTSGKVLKTFYDSSKIGGELTGASAPEGLNQINDKLKDWFYVDTFSPKQERMVQFYISLEGETQGNIYQNAAATIQARFAVEPVKSNTTTGGGGTSTLYSTRPKTGDAARPGLWAVMALLCAGGFTVMRRKRKALAAFVLVAMLFASAVPAYAEDYQYSVSLDYGNLGKYLGVTQTQKASYAQNAQVNFGSIINKKLTTNEGKIYYVKGLHLTGRDAVENNGQDSYTPSFRVTEDVMLSVTYGVYDKDKAVDFTVNYVDSSGKKLIDSKTLSGNIGDKPVLAYEYIDGYTPNVMNLTKTLTSNSKDNVFTFTYSPVVTTNNTTGGGGGGGGTTTVITTGGDNTGTAADAQATPSPSPEASPTPQPSATPNVIPAITPAPEPTPAPATPAPTPAPTPEPTLAPAPTPIPELVDLDIPQDAPLVRISDVGVPLATLQQRAKNGDRSAVSAIVLKIFLVVMVLALVAFLIWFFMRRRKRPNPAGAYGGYNANPGAIRDMNYPNSKYNYTPDEFNVDDLFK